MKNLFSTAAFVMIAVLLITPAFAQKQKSKDDAFKEIAALTNSKKPEDLEKAYKQAKEFVTRFAADKDDKVTHIKGFVAKYRLKLFLGAVDNNKYAEAFALGKEILAEEPDNTEVVINMAYTGYNARNDKGDKSYVDESAGYAAKSIEMMAAGNLPKSFAPYKTQDEATGWMYFIGGFLVFEKDTKTAAINAYKALQYETPIKTDPLPYYMIATFYENQYAALSTAKGDQKKIDTTIDLMLDAYARTCKRAEAVKNANTDHWKARFAQIYKFRKKTDVGLAEFMTMIDASPMPDPAKL